jgi:hypothetical protein
MAGAGVIDKAGAIFDPKRLKNLGTVATVVTVVIIGFYATGMYRNYLEIKEIKKQNK